MEKIEALLLVEFVISILCSLVTLLLHWSFLVSEIEVIEKHGVFINLSYKSSAMDLYLNRKDLRDFFFFLTLVIELFIFSLIFFC